MKSQLARFGSIGAINTAVDFLIFGLLANLAGVHYVPANVISTGCALGISFFLNGKVTFRSKLTGKTALLFLSTTLFGLWVLQPIIIFLSEPLLSRVLDNFISSDTTLLLAKVIATGFSLTWNFILYKYVVFQTVNSGEDR